MRSLGVSRIVEAEEFFGGGTGRRLLLTLAYDFPEPNLPERLFIEDICAVESHRDECFREHENARIQLHMMTKMLVPEG